MKTKLDELKLAVDRSISQILTQNTQESWNSLHYNWKEFCSELKARELRDAEQKEPPYDREAFRRELIVSMVSHTTNYSSILNVFDQADAIITEYERRRENG